jgi:hypothetical protein
LSFLIKRRKRCSCCAECGDRPFFAKKSLINLSIFPTNRLQVAQIFGKRKSPMKRRIAFVLSILFLIALLAESNANAASRGTIYVGPSASGEAPRILSTGYMLQPLSSACLTCFGVGVVVGPADLWTPWIIDRLKAAYEGGHAVGITDATVSSIERLRDLLGHRGSAQPVSGGTQVDLSAFRRAQRP